MAAIRQERNDDRVRIRAESDAFLARAQFNTSDYAKLQFDKIWDVLTEAGAMKTRLLNAPDISVTGALSAILPMQIAIADENNNRLQFTMLVNPSNMNHGKTSAVYANYTRKGYVTQLWGPNQDLITSTGKSAAFMVEGSGLTNIARRRSFGYVNFLALFTSYRNNGYQLLDPSAIKAPLTRVINTVHGVEIFYDNQIFMGHFNNFTLDESAETPFLFNYNFEFVISSLSSISDEVRGHFLPIGREYEKKEATLLSDIEGNVKIEVSLLSPEEEERLSPGIYTGPLE